MIEKLISRSGSAILKYNGKLLCSKIDPQKEAEQWVAKNESVAKKSPTLFILGLGCGYHVVELQKQFPKKNLIVIEPLKELIELNKEIHSMELSNVTLVSTSNIKESIASSRLQSGLKDLYAVLKYPGAYQAHAEFFDPLHEILLGRGEEQLQVLLKSRPNIKELIDASEGPRTVVQQKLSIKTLNEWIKAPTQGCELDFMMIRALKELVN